MTKYSRRKMLNSRNNLKRHYLKDKDFFWIFSCISEMCINLEYLEKKDEYSSLVISRVSDSERGGYLNV